MSLPARLRRRQFLAAAATPWLAHAQSAAPTVLRVTAIPDEAPTELARKFAPLGRYLQQQLGMQVEWTPVTDYAAAVEALVNRQVELAWFGGFTFVQASVRSGNQVVPLVQREEDTRFRSVFITDAASPIRALGDLKGRSLSFGSASSTSGHLMPRSALLAAGIVPERDCKRIAFSGAHDATLLAVASGRVDAGALNISVWEKFVAEKKVDPAQVRVFHTTAPYHDYNWSVHAGLPAAVRDKLQKAFLALDPTQPAHQEILALQRATRFVPAAPEHYAGIRSAAEQAGLLK